MLSRVLAGLLPDGRSGFLEPPKLGHVHASLRISQTRSVWECEKPNSYRFADKVGGVEHCSRRWSHLTVDCIGPVRSPRICVHRGREDLDLHVHVSGKCLPSPPERSPGIRAVVGKVE